MGLVVSVVEESVPDMGKTLPGSCAAVWGLQPEQGDPSRGCGDCPHVLAGWERTCLWVLPTGTSRGATCDCKAMQITEYCQIKIPSGDLQLPKE